MNYINRHLFLLYIVIVCRLESLDLLVGIGNIGLVLVDSIASLLRKEYDTRTSRGVAERSTMLLFLTTILKYSITIHPSIHPSIYLSFHPFIHPSIYLSIYTSIYPFIHS